MSCAQVGRYRLPEDSFFLGVDGASRQSVGEELGWMAPRVAWCCHPLRTGMVNVEDVEVEV